MRNLIISTRRILIAAATIFIVRFIFKFKRKLKGWRRSSELAQKIPSVKRSKEAENTLDLYGGIVRHFPSHIREFSTERIAKYYVQSQMYNLRNELKGEGIVVNWIVNPKYTPFPMGLIHIIDGELARQVLSTKSLPFLKKGRAYGISSELIGRGLLSTTGEEWHKQRIVVERGFTQELIEKQFPMVIETANDLIDRFNLLLKEKEEVRIDLIEEMLKTTMDVLGRAAFSYEIGSLKCDNTKDAPLYDAFETMLETLHKRIYYPFKHFTRSFWPSTENKLFKKSLNRLNTVIKTIINKRHKDGINEVPEDLLDIMLQGTVDAKGNKVQLSEQKIIENMRTMLFAGHDTTAAALTWSFYLLAKHPEKSKKILEEFQKFGGEMTVQTLERCSYLNAVVLEVLRLYPSAGFTRQVLEEFEVGGYTLPKGVDLLILPYFIQRNDPNVEDVDSFIPERWLKKDKEQRLGLQAKLAKATLNETYLPFSLGKRNCVGRKLALLEIRVIILTVLHKFKITLPKEKHEDFQEVPYLGLTLYPKGVCVNIQAKGN